MESTPATFSFAIYTSDEWNSVKAHIYNALKDIPHSHMRVLQEKASQLLIQAKSQANRVLEGNTPDDDRIISKLLKGSYLDMYSISEKDIGTEYGSFFIQVPTYWQGMKVKKCKNGILYMKHGRKCPLANINAIISNKVIDTMKTLLDYPENED